MEGIRVCDELPETRPLVYFPTLTHECQATVSTEHERLPRSRPAQSATTEPRTGHCGDAAAGGPAQMAGLIE